MRISIAANALPSFSEMIGAVGDACKKGAKAVADFAIRAFNGGVFYAKAGFGLAMANKGITIGALSLVALVVVGKILYDRSNPASGNSNPPSGSGPNLGGDSASTIKD